MKKSTKFIGMDVHRDSISVAVAPGDGAEVRFLGDVGPGSDDLRRLVRKLARGGSRLSFCYEAGPCGYGLYRTLTDWGHECAVVAPSLIPRKAGERVKTDRRDGLSLARLHRAGELTAVWVPELEQEAMRDLTRARAAMPSRLSVRRASGSMRFCFATASSTRVRAAGRRHTFAGWRRCALSIASSR